MLFLSGKASSATKTYGVVMLVPGMTVSLGRCSLFSKSCLPRLSEKKKTPSLLPPQEPTSTMTNFPLASVTASKTIGKKKPL